MWVHCENAGPDRRGLTLAMKGADVCIFFMTRIIKFYLWTPTIWKIRHKHDFLKLFLSIFCRCFIFSVFHNSKRLIFKIVINYHYNFIRVRGVSSLDLEPEVEDLIAGLCKYVFFVYYFT